MDSFEGFGRGRRLALEVAFVSLCMGVALLVGLGTATAHAAEAPPLLWGKEPLVCPSGSGAGQCQLPRGIAADPTNGHVFVADQANNRTDEFNAAGQFVKTWGWGVDTGAAELQTCTEASGCQEGLSGGGAGQFGSFSPQGVAVDSAGDIYFVDRGLPSNGRVEKFDLQGHFVLMFGGEVNKTKVEAGGASEEEESLCPFDPGDECQGGTEGSGKGQFGTWPPVGNFIAIDDKGTSSATDDKVYVGDVGRIQIFDTGGHYQGEFAVPGTVEGLSTDAAGNLYAIYGGDIHKLSPSGAPLPPEVFKIPKLDPFENPAATAVAVDAIGHVFAFGPIFGGGSGSPRDPIVEFDSAGKVIAEFGKGEFTAASTGLATNLCAGSESPGNLYVTNPSSSEAFLRAYGSDPIGCFKARTGEASDIGEATAILNGTVDPDGLAVSECFFEYGETTAYDHLAECDEPEAGEITGSDPVPVHADVAGLDKGTVYHFRLIAKIGGETETGADEEFKTFGPPTISGEHSASVAYTEATLKAQVNPEGFATTYRFQYTTLGAFDEHGFEGAQSTPSIGVGSDGDRVEHPVAANLEGLMPGTAYRWRILATNESGSAESEEARAFATYRTALAETNCPNQAFRTAASALLPDCRAYEMVSPVDKNGGDIVSGLSNVADPGGYVQAAPDGERIAYTAIFAAFAGQPASVALNQYLAARGEDGWSSEGIHPPTPGHPVGGLSRQFSAFSADLCSAWLLDPQSPPLAADGQEGLPNLYRRQNCEPGAGGLESLAPSPPALPDGTEGIYVNADSVQGLSEDSRHALFVARAALTADASSMLEEPGLTAAQVYDRFESENHLVSVLPTGKADASKAAVGSGIAGPGNLDNAVAQDGSRVYWTSGIDNIGRGRIYLRIHPEQGSVVGECSEVAIACTLPVSAAVGAFYWTASADGSKAVYGEGEGEDLFEFDLEKAEKAEPPRRLIAHHVVGVAGASEDLARIYFVSTDALNDEDEGEEEGQPNLYLAEGETFHFVATLVDGDVGAKEPDADYPPYNIVSRSPYERATRVTDDGARIAFESQAPLTGFDNADAESGAASVEVYLYEAGGALTCVSCNPSGAAPSGGREMLIPYIRPSDNRFHTHVTVAAWIPTWEHKLHASNLLSSDGNRLFFNSNDALLPRDGNGAQDVYEWEAPGTGACNTASASYFPQNGGCLYLISSGESSHESEFWEADPDGSDVFFTTESSLLPQDPGSIDLYDARVDGGFPQPPAKAECEGETCQSPPAPPAFATPSSSSYNGPRNPKPGKGRCPKGKHKVRKGGKAHCAKKKHKAKGKKSHSRRANPNRRAAR